MYFPLYFQKVIWQWKNFIFKKKIPSEKAKPLRINPSIRIGGFQKLSFTFVHYYPLLIEPFFYFKLLNPEDEISSSRSINTPLAWQRVPEAPIPSCIC